MCKFQKSGCFCHSHRFPKYLHDLLGLIPKWHEFESRITNRKKKERSTLRTLLAAIFCTLICLIVNARIPSNSSEGRKRS